MRRVVTALFFAGLMAISSPSQGATQSLSAVGFIFVPPVVAAAGSDSLTLTNRDVAFIPGHTFTTDALLCEGRDALGNKIRKRCDTGMVSAGGSATVKLFAPSGIYDFYCSLHRAVGMVGRLVVTS